jgi:diacylglycerol kinase (ATP)
VARERQGHITHLSYFWPTFRTLFEHRFPHLTVEADGQPVFAGRGVALIGNIPRYALGLRIHPRARCDDALLDLCVLPCRGRVGVLRHTFNIWRGRHLKDPTTLYRQCRSVKVSSPDRVPLELDGDYAGNLPVDLRIHPGGLHVLAPA